MTTKNTYQAIRAHVSGSYRTETLHGKEYIVVPVVALVEGVLQGMSSSGPELALAEEFGRFPDSWNGRPVVMSHPINDKGAPVSANSPQVLEKYQIGFLFNTKLDGTQLNQEAWVDKSLIESVGEDAQEVLATLEKGEIIEVSTGYFALIEETSGMYANQEYIAIQRQVVPDHLAFLPMGTVGACSNADGCGAKLAANSSPNTDFERIVAFRVDVPCCSKCAETGGSCQHEGHMPEANVGAKAKSKSVTEGAREHPKAYQALTIANTLSDAILMDDAADIVCDALRDTYGPYVYLVGLTTLVAVFQMYDNINYDYDTYQISYSLDGDGKVTLGNDLKEVTLLTRIVPEDDGDDASETGDATMTNNAQPGGASASQANTKPVVRSVTNEQGTLEVTYNDKNEPTGYRLIPNSTKPKAPATMEEFVAQAPKEFQEVITSSLKLHTDQKQALITQIKGTKRCKMSDEKLNAMSLLDLQEIAELANVPDFGGRALPLTSANTEPTEENVAPAPLVFEVKKPAIAA